MPIKEYIITCRNQKIPDSKILAELNKSNWPEDIIQQAFSEADVVVQAVPEPVEDPITEEKPAEKQENEIVKEAINPSKEPRKRKPFAFMSLIALFFSPVPFVGLYIASAVLDDIHKTKKSGAIFAIMAMLINAFVIIFVIYFIFQIFTLEPDKLTGFSKFLNDKFSLV